MSDEKKPNVFLNKNILEEANNNTARLNNEFYEKLKETGAYDELGKKLKIDDNNSLNKPQISEAEKQAAEEMRRKTEEIIKMRDANGGKTPLIIREDLAEPTMYQAEVSYGNPTAPKMDNFKVVENTEPTHANNYKNIQYKLDSLEEKYAKLSQPQQNIQFDVIPLPSKGKLYKNKKQTIKIGYLNASDENILTNPNLLESGKFLEILINRKMIDTDLCYKDLHVGDRNAIMIWLRSTAYGYEYPIEVYDPATGQPFETNIDLSQLKMIELKADTDVNGHIDYQLNNGDILKIRLLTVGDIDDIEEHAENVKNTLGIEFLDLPTYILKKHVVAVNGNYDKEMVGFYVDRMRLGEVKTLRKYINDIESGMDMNLIIKTPGGESINTIFPINSSFFWPNI